MTQSLRERIKEKFPMFSVRYRSQRICGKYPHFKTLLDYLNEKSILESVYYQFSDKWLGVRLNHIEFKFVEEVIAPWVNTWALRHGRGEKVYEPHFHPGHEYVLLEIPLTYEEASTIKFLIDTMQRRSGKTGKSLEEIRFLTASFRKDEI